MQLEFSATVSATKVDSFIFSSQRSCLGMCKRCGDLKLIPCSSCKGSGLIKQAGPFTFLPIIDGNPDFSVKSKSQQLPPCAVCRSRGHFPCPQCSKLPKS